MERKHYLAAAVVSLAILTTLYLAAESSFNGEQQVVPERNLSGQDYMTTEDGKKYTVHPSELVLGCPGKDCIPSIDDPSFETVEESDWMRPDDPVIGIEEENVSKAYPLRILDRHEIVNDEIAGERIVVTYCPLCRSGVTYSRNINGENLEFGVSGKLLNANLVMYDRSTESYWSQIRGNAIIGPRTGQSLELVHSSVSNWSSWKSGHPNTSILSRDTGIYPASTYQGSAYSSYKKSQRVGFGVGNVDDRLESKTVVYGINLNGSSKAYPEQDIREDRLIQDEVGGTPVAVLENPKDGTIVAFIRKNEGEKLDLSLENGRLVDSSGTAWDVEDDRLERISTKGFYWFAWSKFNQDTSVYNQS